ncbi:unclassified [Brachyspira pilosicoli WesB]|uniref:Unclassified n=1 Tax=Brachyspira pilosicoli WesB TaxID=1161918 RepID=K0JMY9_BRAPL|nr:hypothetical protein [Brachyspira pilosicoli]CCG58020.1 unclassified [Brachyspira pilosicoli WesB]
MKRLIILIIASYKNLFSNIIKTIQFLREDTPLNVLDAIFYLFNILKFIISNIYYFLIIPFLVFKTKKE